MGLCNIPIFRGVMPAWWCIAWCTFCERRCQNTASRSSANTNNLTIWRDFSLSFKENFNPTVGIICNIDIYTWINPEKVFGFSQSIQCSEFCFQHRSFLFTSIMIQSLGKLKGAGGEIITYWGFQYWIIKVMIIFQQNSIVENNRLGVGKIEMSC